MKLVCSLCGYESPQKKFRYSDINRHFENAVQIWCPRNDCKEKYGRKVPEGFTCHTWYDYVGWQTVEPQTPEEHEAVLRARKIQDEGIRIYKIYNRTIPFTTR